MPLSGGVLPGRNVKSCEIYLHCSVAGLVGLIRDLAHNSDLHMQLVVVQEV